VWRKLIDDTFVLSLGLIPAAIGVAILRYHLYEIDVIIRRTLVYATLVGSLALIYLAGVYGMQAAVRSVSGQSGTVAVTLSTLLVAAAFQPLRARIQRAVDHRFYRARYDAGRTLDAFSGRLREQVDIETVSGEVLDVVRQTLQPTHATLWIRRPEAGR
jgi:ABC-type phosphate transport system substrate-binding protein